MSQVLLQQHRTGETSKILRPMFYEINTSQATVAVKKLTTHQSPPKEIASVGPLTSE